MVGEFPTPESAAVMTAATSSGRPAAKSENPGEWARKNLFNSPHNSLITVVLGLAITFVAFRLLRFVFSTGQWAAVRVNLELFMVGLFPREERWRIIAQVILVSGAIGAVAGSLRQTAIDQARESGTDWKPSPLRELISSYWAIAAFVLITMAAFVRTPSPWFVLAAAVASAGVARQICVMLPLRFRNWGWTLAAVLAVVEMQVLTGTGGLAWVYGTIAVAVLVRDEVGRLAQRSRVVGDIVTGAGALAGVAILAVRSDLIGIGFVAIGAFGVVSAVRGDRIDASRLGAVTITGLVAYFVYDAIGLSGVDWSEWGGLHLNLVATPIAIGLGFPFGLLLALGRRSKLPAVRTMSVAYIEFFRGAPLITFLLAAQFFLGFFLDTDTPLSLITRAIASITLFTSAYIAEIVRGGLQAVPAGQIEAGQAMGLSQPKIMRLIVLPQALRAVIPAMVGQFISLFKDTSLLVILGIDDFLGVRELVHAQPAFRGQGIGETLIFVAFGFWAFAFTMSRESQRLERRLDVGTR